MFDSSQRGSGITHLEDGVRRLDGSNKVKGVFVHNQIVVGALHIQPFVEPRTQSGVQKEVVLPGEECRRVERASGAWRFGGRQCLPVLVLRQLLTWFLGRGASFVQGDDVVVKDKFPAMAGTLPS